MARDYAQIHHLIWQDPDFVSMPAADQRLYFLLLSQASMNYAGKLDLTVARWARHAPDTTAADVRASLERLHARRYVLVDEDTEEALIRTFIRNDGLWSNVRMLRVAVREARQVHSQALRAALGEELSKLPAVAIPQDPKMTRAIAEAQAVQAELNEAIAQLSGGGGGPGSGARQPLSQPLPQPLAQPLAQGVAQGAGDGDGDVVGAGAFLPTTSKTSNHLGGGSHVSKGSPEQPPLYADRCSKHGNVAEPGNCGGCADVRKANAGKPRAPLQLVVKPSDHAPWCGECEDTNSRVIETDRGIRWCERCHPNRASKCLIHMTPNVQTCEGCAEDRKAASA